MDGVVAPLDKICDLADKYDAMVMVDECHATGFIERQEKEHLRQRSNGKSRYYNWNSWKALGGAMGGYTTAKKEIIELRQRSRPYLFSNFSARNCWSIN
jgi:glycine C-acetyltransferase